MSTRSNIGVVCMDGAVKFIYCHNDGYPGHHVPLLVGHYDTVEKALALVAPGSMSVLDRSVGDKHDFGDRPDGVCSYYGRDRGEKNTEARVATSVDAFDAAATNDYAYLFRDGAWVGRNRRGAWVPVRDMLTEDDES